MIRRAASALFVILASCSAPPSLPLFSTEAEQFEAWAAIPQNKADLAALSDYLARHKVDNVVQLRYLVRSDVNWRRCNAPQFLVPPKRLWPHLVPTLRLLKEEVIPRWGAVEPLSVYRSAAINECLGGASRSAHMRFYALDMKFRQPVEPEQLVTRLCSLHKRIGPKWTMGLGIYKGERFHIDTHSYRSWGHDQRGATSPCRAQT